MKTNLRLEYFKSTYIMEFLAGHPVDWCAALKSYEKELAVRSRVDSRREYMKDMANRRQQRRKQTKRARRADAQAVPQPQRPLKHESMEAAVN